MKQPDYRLIISVVTIVLSLGSAYGVTNYKLKNVEKTADKVGELDKSMAEEKTKVHYLEQGLMEQRQLLKEQRTDTKEILKILMNR
jgi:hypothetical protein